MAPLLKNIEDPNKQAYKILEKLLRLKLITFSKEVRNQKILN